MNILAIETSCDETAFAVVSCSGGLKSPKLLVKENLISSQIEVHRPYGGVVPNLAKREHLKNLPILYKEIQNKIPLEEIDAIAVTVGPGLDPALWTGVEYAKELKKETGLPLLGANHLEGHIFSNWLQSEDTKDQTKNIAFPAIALLVSGGHTILLHMESMTEWKKLGETQDDAVGEAFDKVARMLGLPYPGGPEISRLAKKGDCKAIEFPQPMRHHKNNHFSFSGVKTAVLYYIRDKEKELGRELNNAEKADVAASFENAVTEVLTYKTKRAAEEYGAKIILLAGGVAANAWLRKKLQNAADEIGIIFNGPEKEYNTDNAAMIAAAAYIRHEMGKKYRITSQPNLNL